MSILDNLIENVAMTNARGIPPQLLAKMMKKSTGSATSFNNFLTYGTTNPVLAGSLTGMTAPTLPTPPSNPSDPAAQLQYSNAMQLYNQQYQQYTMQMMQTMMARFGQMQQQSLMQFRQTAAQPASSSSSADKTAIGVGGILDTDSSSSI